MQKEKDILEKSRQFAEKTGIRLNPDEKIAAGIIKGLLKNKEKHGELYCPCRRVTDSKEEDKKIICPCIYHQEEIRTQGYCHCRLFVKKE